MGIDAEDLRVSMMLALKRVVRFKIEVLSVVTEFFFEVDVDDFVLGGSSIDNDEFFAGDAATPAGGEYIGREGAAKFCDFFEWSVADDLEVAV